MSQGRQAPPPLLPPMGSPPHPPCGFWVGPPPLLTPLGFGCPSSGLCSTCLLTKLPAAHCYHLMLDLI